MGKMRKNKINAAVLVGLSDHEIAFGILKQVIPQ
jgi:hypothetical protein